MLVEADSFGCRYDADRNGGIDLDELMLACDDFVRMDEYFTVYMRLMHCGEWLASGGSRRCCGSS